MTQNKPDSFVLPSIEAEYRHTAETDDMPVLSSKGRILVHVLGGQDENGQAYQISFDVLDYDRDSAVFWIEEGTGFDWFFENDVYNVEDAKPGHYVLEGVRGYATRGDGWETDDNVDFEYDLIRPATDSEIATQCLSRGSSEAEPDPGNEKPGSDQTGDEQ